MQKINSLYSVYVYQTADIHDYKMNNLMQNNNSNA